MLFNSFKFWMIYPFVFSLFWMIPAKMVNMRKWYLIVVSYILYMNWNAGYSLILLGITALTYCGGLVFNSDRYRNKRCLLLFLLVATLLPLLVFKYYNFINRSGMELLSFIGLKFSLPGLNWTVPVGISFFTFQAVGYMLDVWHKKIETERNFSDYMLFVSFFPQTASGPISKASELLPQIKNRHVFVYEQAKQGLKILLWGMFLKVVVADRLGMYVDTVYDNYTYYSGLTCFVASVLYSIQIYGDFAGYSLMAVGIAKTLGFDLVNNFERPYFAPTITEFWRRWHISLTRWLTTHVYIPLGGSRRGKKRTYWNILITFMVSGIWHGANWTFVIWGMLHGLFQIVEKFWGLQKCESGRAVKYIRIFITFLCVNFAWIFFRMPSVTDAWAVICKIFTSGEFSLFLDTNTNTVLTLLAFTAVVLKDGMDEFCPCVMRYGNRKPMVRWTVYLMLFMSLLLFGVLDSGQFIYISF